MNISPSVFKPCEIETMNSVLPIAHQILKPIYTQYKQKLSENIKEKTAFLEQIPFKQALVATSAFASAFFLFQAQFIPFIASAAILALTFKLGFNNREINNLKRIGNTLESHSNSLNKTITKLKNLTKTQKKTLKTFEKRLDRLKDENARYSDFNNEHSSLNREHRTLLSALEEQVNRLTKTNSTTLIC